MEEELLNNMIGNVTLGQRKFYRVQIKNWWMKKLEKFKKFKTNSKKIKQSLL